MSSISCQILIPNQPSREAITSYQHVVGVGGHNGDGDITKTDNVAAFQDYIMNCTDNQGVHFVMADGVSKQVISS